jgi:uncharacterized membrane protein ArfC
MHDINWWLMALAFLLGLVLTLFLTVGRVNGDAPVDQPVAEENER